MVKYGTYIVSVSGIKAVRRGVLIREDERTKNKEYVLNFVKESLKDSFLDLDEAEFKIEFEEVT